MWIVLIFAKRGRGGGENFIIKRVSKDLNKFYDLANIYIV